MRRRQMRTDWEFTASDPAPGFSAGHRRTQGQAAEGLFRLEHGRLDEPAGAELRKMLRHGLRPGVAGTVLHDKGSRVPQNAAQVQVDFAAGKTGEARSADGMHRGEISLVRLQPAGHARRHHNRLVTRPWSKWRPFGYDTCSRLPRCNFSPYGTSASLNRCTGV